MKKLIAKIRNKRLKGNISLLVILVLLASSVISLLSINQIQRLMTYGNMTFNYFRAFYLAKAGTELGLTEVYNSGDWFSHAINSESAIVTWNLLSEYSGFNPYFDMTVTWQFLYLTEDVRESGECGSWIKLATWAWIMLSLFSDDNGDKGLHTILSGNVGNKPLDNIKDLSLVFNGGSELTFALFTYNKDDDGNEFMEDLAVEKWGTLLDFFNKENVKNLMWSNAYKKYLTIKNSWSEDVEFCVYKEWDFIPYSDFLITVFWHYGDMEVWLQSIIKKWVPDWTLNVIDD